MLDLNTKLHFLNEIAKSDGLQTFVVFELSVEVINDSSNKTVDFLKGFDFNASKIRNDIKLTESREIF